MSGLYRTWVVQMWFSGIALESAAKESESLVYEKPYETIVNFKGLLVDALVSRGDEGGGRLP